MEHDVKLIPLDRIDVGRRLRARRDEAVAELAESIREVGLLHPITVVRVDGGYRLVTGLHRLEAYRRLGLPEIPSRVLDVDDVDAELAEIDENLVRRTLSFLEQAEHVARRDELLRARGERAPSHRPGKGASAAPFRTTATIAEQVGMSERTLQERMQIARGLSEDVRDLLRGTAVADDRDSLLGLVRLPDPAERMDVARLVADGRATTVWDARAAIDRANRRRRDRCRTCGQPSADLVQQTCPARAKRAGMIRAEHEKLRVKFTSLTNASERCIGVDATSMAQAIEQKGGRSALSTIRELRGWLDAVEAALGAVAEVKARTTEGKAKTR